MKQAMGNGLTLLERLLATRQLSYVILQEHSHLIALYIVIPHLAVMMTYAEKISALTQMSLRGRGTDIANARLVGLSMCESILIQLLNFGPHYFQLVIIPYHYYCQHWSCEGPNHSILSRQPAAINNNNNNNKCIHKEGYCQHTRSSCHLDLVSHSCRAGCRLRMPRERQGDLHQAKKIRQREKPVFMHAWKLRA